MKTFDHIINTNKSQVIIDLDGTICDILIDWSGWETGLASLFSKYDKTTIKSIIDENKDQNKYVAKFGDDLLNELTTFIANYEAKYTTGFEPVTPTIELIQKIKNLDLYVWSANSENTVKRALEQLGLSNYFKHIVGRESVKMQKPDPEGFSIIHSLKPNLAKESYIFIGNAPTDYQAAVRAGIEYINVNEIVN